MDANKTYQIWTGDNDTDGGIVINKKEIENVICLGNMTVFGVPNVGLSEDELQKQFKESGLNITDNEELQDWLESIGVPQQVIDSVYMLADVAETKELIVFDETNQTFSNLADFNTVESYQYWDGSNWKREWVETYSISEDITIVPDSKICLDEWDGRNMVTGGIGQHEYIYKIATLDNEEVNDKYLLVFSSQWQGVQDTAKIVDKDDIEAHLKEIDRNVEEYMVMLK